MKKNMLNLHPMIKSFSEMLIELPTPTTISYMWNWGSMLGVMLGVQIITGILLASHYSSDINMAFPSVIHIIRDVENGWMMRTIHMNGAAMFFILIYMHIARGMIFSSFKLTHVWASGVTIVLILMATAFLGYVLPWGQMSFWGTSVITNLISSIPYIGQMIVEWVWGGFSVNQATLSRFFSLHFLMPFILSVFIIMHLMSLHETGSNSPSNVNSNFDKVSFHPFFSFKDIYGLLIFFLIFLFISYISPYSMGDPENFNTANPLNTPIHIQPEWYFLFAYAVLRSIPNKLGGVVALAMSIFIIIALTPIKINIKSKKFTPNNKLIVWMFFNIFIILTWIGANPVEQPFELIGKIFSILYFMFVLSLCFFLLFWKQLKSFS